MFCLEKRTSLLTQSEYDKANMNTHCRRRKQLYASDHLTKPQVLTFSIHTLLQLQLVICKRVSTFQEYLGAIRSKQYTKNVVKLAHTKEDQSGYWLVELNQLQT